MCVYVKSFMVVCIQLYRLRQSELLFFSSSRSSSSSIHK